MAKGLPSWRVDNYIPILMTIISWAFFAGIFITKLNQVIDNQRELTQEVKEWKIQFESRLGQEEKNSVLFANVLKLTIK